MDFENSNSGCKRVITPLEARSVAIDEETRNVAGVGYNVYDATLKGEIISNSLKTIKMSRSFEKGL